jgi:hypothetical protein
MSSTTWQAPPCKTTDAPAHKADMQNSVPLHKWTHCPAGLNCHFQSSARHEDMQQSTHCVMLHMSDASSKERHSFQDNLYTMSYISHPNQ